MAKQSSAESTSSGPGPSGFIELQGHMLVVDFGRIFVEGNLVGFLYEDGLLKSNSDAFGDSTKLRPIEEMHGCVFRGIDSKGLALELPGESDGPTGELTYAGRKFNVVHGRISDEQHRLLGQFDDSGKIAFRYPPDVDKHHVKEESQLDTTFVGTKSDGSEFTHEFQRNLYRRDKTYVENEIYRYFNDHDRLKIPEKKYVADSLGMWAACGALQVVRQEEGDCAMGNVRHGAAGVTAVRRGTVTLDKEEFEKELGLFGRFGPFANALTQWKPYIEVRVNLVVAHEFGHQLEFCLSQKAQKEIESLYQERLEWANRVHPLPEDYNGQAELVLPQQVKERVFISGYARSSYHEYWAECVAAFTHKQSRDYLKLMDPKIYQVLSDVVLNPGNVYRKTLTDKILDLQTSLKLASILQSDILLQ